MFAKKLSVVLAMIPAANAFAAPAPNDLNFDVSAKTRWSDNARKENKKENIFTERQDQYSFQVDGIYNNEWVSAKSQYDISQLKFSENSQPNDNVLTGNSSLVLGAANQPLSLSLTHASDQLINSPDAVDLTTNRDERSTFVVQPSLRIGANEARQFVASVSRTNIDYKRQKERSLNTDAIEAAYVQKLSAIDQVQLIATSSKTNFDLYPLADYKLQSALLEYSAVLRKLKYSVSVGGNKITQNEQDNEFSSPQYHLNLSYAGAFNVLNVDFDQRLSDSSSSGVTRQRNNIEESGSVVDRLGYDIGVVKNISTTFSWQSTYLCERCSTGLTVSDSKEDMLSLNNDFSMRRASASFSYKLTRFSSLDISGIWSERKYDQSFKFGRSREMDSRVSYRVMLMNHLWLESFFSRIDAETDKAGSEYVENVMGVRFNAEF